MRFSVLFLLWPLVEITLFIVIGGEIGVLATLAVILGTAALGIWLLRRMGVRRWPGDPLRAAASGGMTMLAGVLLILPGFLTDALGLLLLLPPLQALAAGWLSRHVVLREGGARRGADIIDGEFIEIEPETLPASHRDGRDPGDRNNGPDRNNGAGRNNGRPPSGWTQH